MKQIDDWWWPDGDVNARPALLREVENVRKVVDLMDKENRRGCVIQAGGNTGLFPDRLARAFQRVVTFEPDRENFACMSRNVAAPNVEMHNAALGQAESTCRIIPEPLNCGAGRVALDGEIPVLTIDGLGLAPDLIWLDVEGFEPFALRGAEQTLRKHHPLVVVEEKGHSRRYGVEPEETQAFLKDLGYTFIETVGRDRVYG